MAGCVRARRLCLCWRFVCFWRRMREGPKTPQSRGPQCRRRRFRCVVPAGTWLPGGTCQQCLHAGQRWESTVEARVGAIERQQRGGGWSTLHLAAGRAWACLGVPGSAMQRRTARALFACLPVQHMGALFVVLAVGLEDWRIGGLVRWRGRGGGWSSQVAREEDYRRRRQQGDQKFEISWSLFSGQSMADKKSNWSQLQR